MQSRISNIVKNVKAVIIAEPILAILSILVRKQIVLTIGVELFGIHDLFISIINLISTFDFGIAISSAFYYSKSFAGKNEEEIEICFYSLRKLYRFLELAYFVIFIVIAINIGKIIDNTNLVQMAIIFIILGISSIISISIKPYEFLFYYDQKQSVTQYTRLIVSFIAQLFQLICAILFKNYYLYFVILLLENAFLFIIFYFFSRNYFLKNNISKEKINERSIYIINYGKSTFINSYIVSAFSLKNNIIISLFQNDNVMKLLGKISNYNVIFTIISTGFNSIATGVHASLYNYINDDEVNSKNNIIGLIKKVLFLSYCISSFCSIFLLLLSTLFIGLYYGEEYVISNNIVLVLSINIALDIFLTFLHFYHIGTGKIKQENIPFVIIFVISLFSSIFLTYKYGIIGTYLGTSIGYLLRLITSITLISSDLKTDAKIFFGQMFKYLLLIAFELSLIMFMINRISISVVAFIKCIAVGTVLYMLGILMFYKTEEFKYAKDVVFAIIKREKI